MRPTLALDLASQTGFALGLRHERPKLGTVAFPQRQHPARFRGLEEWLNELADQHGGFAEIAHYAKGGFVSALAMKLHWGFAITVETWCWDNATPYRTEHEGTARKLLLGRGGFKKGEAKPAVAAWARGRGLQGTADAYDAALLLQYCLTVPHA